jgi:peptide/nickel transport system permease protein
MSDIPLKTVSKTSGGLDHLIYVLRANPVTLLAFGMFALIVLSAVFGPMLVPYDPLQTNASMALQPPSWDHWFGTDNVGRDVFSRVIVATRLDLSISVAAVALSFVAGSVLGSIAGYWGGWLDIVLNRVLDTIMAFPLFVLAMGIVAALGNTIENIIYATAIINVPFYARLVRAEVNIRRNAGFVQAAKLAGNSDIQVLALHIFPNALPPMMVQVSLNLGWAILNAAGLE